MKLNQYDPHTYAVAGNAADELEFGDSATGRSLPDGSFAGARYRDGGGRSGNPGRGLRRATVWLGFALGAYYGYRWLTDRLRDDAAVDVAPPLDESRGPINGGVSPPNEPATETAPAREY